MEITRNDLVVCDNSTLNYLIKNVYKKQLLDFKVIDYNKFIEGYFGTIDKQALIELQKTYHYEYAKILIKNYLLAHYLEIPDENFALITPYLKINEVYQTYLKSFENIYFINADKTSLLICLCEKKIPNLKFIDLEKSNTSQLFLTTCETIEEEVINLTNNLLTNFNNNEQYKIFIPSNKYLLPIMRIFSLYKIPYQTSKKYSLMDLDITKDLLDYLDNNYSNYRKTEDLFSDAAEEFILNNEIIEVLNDFCEYDLKDYQYFRLMLKDAFQNKTISAEGNSLIVLTDKLPSVTINENYYLLGLNQNVFPKVILDNDYFSDEIKAKYGLITSSEANNYLLTKTKKQIMQMANCYLSYNRDDHQVPSVLLSNLPDLQMKKINLTNNFEAIYDEYCFAMALDDYDIYGIEQPNLKNLFSASSLKKYSSYDNKFKGTFKVKDDLMLSYTSINAYFQCRYRYYLDNILNVLPKEITPERVTGDICHDILKKLSSKKITTEEIDSEITKYLELHEPNLTALKNFYYHFLTDYLKKANGYISKIEKRIYHSVTYKYEHKLSVNFGRDTVSGIIDKLGIFGNNEAAEMQKTYFVVDYKTGEINQELPKIYSGLSLQIPIYLYLVNKNNPSIFPYPNILGGFFQKVLPKKPLDYASNSLSDQEFDLYRYEGITTTDLKGLGLLDADVILGREDKSFIKSVKVCKNGMHKDFYRNAFSGADFEKLLNVVESHIKTALSEIHDGFFNVDPKIFYGEKETTCQYCKYGAICYKKYADYQMRVLDKNLIQIKETKYDSD